MTLKELKQATHKEDMEFGVEAGRQWATSIDTPEECRALARLRVLSPNSDFCPNCIYFHMFPDNDGDFVAVAEFWQDEAPSPSYVEGFVLGAVAVYQEI